MKIPDDIDLYQANPNESVVEAAWIEAAVKIGLQHGIYVRVVKKTDKNGWVAEILFKVGDNTFGSLTELKRAIKNKAFL